MARFHGHPRSEYSLVPRLGEPLRTPQGYPLPEPVGKRYELLHTHLFDGQSVA